LRERVTNRPESGKNKKKNPRRVLGKRKQNLFGGGLERDSGGEGSPRAKTVWGGKREKEGLRQKVLIVPEGYDVSFSPKSC